MNAVQLNSNSIRVWYEFMRIKATDEFLFHKLDIIDVSSPLKSWSAFKVSLCLVCNIAFWVPLCWTIIYTLVWIPLILLHHVTIFFVSWFRLSSVVWQEIDLKQVNCCLPIGSGILPDFYNKDLFFDGWMSCCFDLLPFFVMKYVGKCAQTRGFKPCPCWIYITNFTKHVSAEHSISSKSLQKNQ